MNCTVNLETSETITYIENLKAKQSQYHMPLFSKVMTTNMVYGPPGTPRVNSKIYVKF